VDHFYLFVVASLGVWRLTHLVSSEDGPWRCFARLRNGLAGRVWAELVTCFYCQSVWMSLPFAIAIGDGWREVLLLWPALSGAAILLERATDRAPAQAEYFEHDSFSETSVQFQQPEEGDRDHVVLRKEH
jgi:hypothetical protein